MVSEGTDREGELVLVGLSFPHKIQREEYVRITDPYITRDLIELYLGIPRFVRF